MVVKGSLRVLALLLVLSLLVAACGTDEEAGDDTEATGDDAAQDDGSGGKEIVIAQGAETPSLDPQLEDSGDERQITDNMYESLLARTAEGELEPLLASEMPEAVDEDTWQFKLNEGIEFHNGEPFNAETVVHSVERVIDPDFGSAQLGYLSSIVGAEAVDEHTVNINTDGPDPVLPARMYFLRIVPVEHSQTENFFEDPVGTGPYRFVEWERGSHVELERNDDYWGEAPPIERVTFRFIPESGTRLSALSAGEVDLIQNLSPEDIEEAPSHESLSPGLDTMTVIVNSEAGPTAERDVRLALNYAIDREAIAEGIYGGYAAPAEGQYLGEAWFGYNPDLETYPYDPERARELLAEAGQEGAQIEFIGRQGRWLKDGELIEAVTNYWLDIGLQVDTKILDVDPYLDRLWGVPIDDRAPGELIFFGHSNELFDADRTASSYFHSEEGVAPTFRNERIDELVTAARQELDEEKREAMYHEMLEIAYEEAYYVPLVNVDDIYGTSEGLVWQPRVDQKIIVASMDLEQ